MNLSDLPALDVVDLVLIMSVVPGFSGQKFMPEVLPKAIAVKKRLRAHQRLEIDGGINADTIAQEVAFLPEGDRPDRYDLPRIRKIIGARLAVAEAIRTKAKT